MAKIEKNLPDVCHFPVFLYDTSPSHSILYTDTENKDEPVSIREHIIYEENNT